MNRRQFLAASAVVAAGCGRNSPGGSVVDAARVAGERALRDQHLAKLQNFRVVAGTTLTTPKPPIDLVSVFPELKGLIKVTVRLHPRFGDEPGPDESKVGGRFLWPAGEPWPTCSEHHTPMVPVLQLRAEDAPPEVSYRPGTDLLQLLWCPRDHAEPTFFAKPAVVWRKRSTVSSPPAEPPPTDTGFPSYIPVPCRVFPERVPEYPPYDVLPVPLRTKIDDWKPGPIRVPDGWVKPTADATSFARSPGGSSCYATLLSTAPGIKVGGYPHFAQGDESPACGKCKWGMDYLLTVDDSEWDVVSWLRWMPEEERATPGPPPLGHMNDPGLDLGGGGNTNVFVCRRCDDWPVTGVGQR
jgi:hypothetical protein